MSTLQTANITDGTNSVETVYVARGSAKAWVNFNGTGTIAARDSLNLSSLTDNGTGDYTVNWTSAFAAADYAASFPSFSAEHFVVSVLTGSVTGGAQNSAGSRQDVSIVCPTAHGDLA